VSHKLTHHDPVRDVVCARAPRRMPMDEYVRVTQKT
jgi:hypothetical protein